MRKLFLLTPFVAALLALAVVACGGDDDDAGSSGGSGGAVANPTAGTSAVQELTVKAGDWYFEPKAYSVRPGVVKVSFSSVGPEFPHTFSVKNKDGNGELFTSERFESGKSGTFEFTVMEEGSYQVICVVRGHADRGQTATLTVSRSLGAAQP